MPLAVWSIVRLSWGFSVRAPGTSAGGSSLSLPPPSTVVGAIARGVALNKRWGEVYGREAYSTAYKLARHLLAAGAGLLEGFVAPYASTMRFLSIPYLRRENRRNVNLWFSAQAFGLVAAGDSRLCLAAVFSESIAEEGVRLRDLEAAAWSIIYLGAKEGLVSVEEAGATEVEESTGGITGYYLPADAVDYVRHSVLLKAWDPRDPNAYRRSKVTPRHLDLVIPVQLELGREVFVGHEGRKELMARVRSDKLTYKVPGPCGVLVGF